MLAAITSGGIIFAYSGWDAAIAFGAESKNPSRNIPIAVIGSMLIGFVIYMGLEIAFLGALRPADLVHGWTNLTLPGNVAGPFAALATGFGLSWFAFVLYIDAIVSPAGPVCWRSASPPATASRLPATATSPASSGT